MICGSPVNSVFRNTGADIRTGGGPAFLFAPEDYIRLPPIQQLLQSRFFTVSSGLTATPSHQR
jgi:antirestriction protein ArdC